MKNVLKATIVAMVIATSGMAQAGGFNLGGTTNEGGTGIADAAAQAKAVAGAVSGSVSGASVISKPSLKQKSSQSLTYNGASVKDTYKRYTPAAFAPSIQPTAPCYVPVSVGAGVPGVSVSGGTAYLDEDCRDEETIRIGLGSGFEETQQKAAAALSARLDAILQKQADAKAEAEAEDTGFVFFDDK